jgi:ubiquinone/menaquinone biosynthesis C-methylase UbiE
MLVLPVDSVGSLQTVADKVSKTELRKTWELAAPGWASWEPRFSAGLTQATNILLDAAVVGPGQRVLDVACGAGSQSILAAKCVGPAGSVVASDISPNMLEHVRRNAEAEGLENIETVECAAEDLSMPPHSFDACISRFGLMLFPSPPSALEAVHRVLKPGARFAALVFTTPANNPFLAQPMGILLRHAGKQPPAPGQPGLFALGGNGVLEELLRDNGLSDIDARTVRAPLSLKGATEALDMMQQAFGAYRAVVADLSEADRSKAWEDVHDCLRQFEGKDGFEAEFELLVGSGLM